VVCPERAWKLCTPLYNIPYIPFHVTSSVSSTISFYKEQISVSDLLSSVSYSSKLTKLRHRSWEPLICSQVRKNL
jgi:hypothetical protein